MTKDRQRAVLGAARLMPRIAVPFSALCAFLLPLEAVVPAVAAWLGLCCLMSWRVGKS